VKILPGILNAKMGRKDIFKPTIGNESLPQDSNDNGTRIVNFTTSKNVVFKSAMFQIRNTHTYIHTPVTLLMGRQTPGLLMGRHAD